MSDKYIPGDYYTTCDISGFKIRFSEAVYTWDNLLVRQDMFDPRQPQDFVRGETEDIAAEDSRAGWETPTFITNTSVTQDDL